MKNQNLELILTFLGIQFIDYKGKRTSNGHVTAKTIGEIKKFFGKEVMTSGQSIDQIKWWDFENDWNDLMFLVEKIEDTRVNNIRYIDFHIMPDAVIVTNQEDEENPLILINKSEGNGSIQEDIIMFETKIQAVYIACVKFIEWYNKQNK